MGNLGDETESIRGRHISFVGSIAIREFVFFFWKTKSCLKMAKISGLYHVKAIEFVWAWADFIEFLM